MYNHQANIRLRYREAKKLGLCLRSEFFACFVVDSGRSANNYSLCFRSEFFLAM